MSIKVEQITWLDHYSAAGWQDVIDKIPVDYVVNSVGFVINETPKYVVLAQSVSDSNSYAELMHILKINITKRKILLK